MIGQEHQASALGIVIAYATQPCGIALLGVDHHRLDFLIADQSGAAIDRSGVSAVVLEARFGEDDEETASLLRAIPPLEVERATRNHIEAVRLGDE